MPIRQIKIIPDEYLNASIGVHASPVTITRYYSPWREKIAAPVCSPSPVPHLLPPFFINHGAMKEGRIIGSCLF